MKSKTRSAANFKPDRSEYRQKTKSGRGAHSRRKNEIFVETARALITKRRTGPWEKWSQFTAETRTGKNRIKETLRSSKSHRERKQHNSRWKTKFPLKSTTIHITTEVTALPPSFLLEWKIGSWHTSTLNTMKIKLGSDNELHPI
jgi:hypothetical protein